MSTCIPVIDLFAGPGGLGEGFTRCKAADFRIAVSIEKDEMAFETLQLRAAHRALDRSGHATPSTWKKWDQTLADHPWNIAFEMLRETGDPGISAACAVARSEAWNLELGPDTREEVSTGIHRRLRPYIRGSRLPSNAVLIGGPPCQAYSIVGRSRNRGNDGYRPEEDHRHFLYLEYLQVIREFQPAVFIMENVKGILSSRVLERQLIGAILEDLRRPDLSTGEDNGLEYELFTLGGRSTTEIDFAPHQFIVQAEAHGIPQARHRVIICGVRRDVISKVGGPGRLRPSKPPSVRDVIADLPRLRFGLSHRGQGMDWLASLDDPLLSRALKALYADGEPEALRVAKRMESAHFAMRRSRAVGTGAERTYLGPGGVSLPAAIPRWYRDRPLALLANHESRTHMPSDLIRYLFVSAFGETTGRSPTLQDFPTCLLPKHRNVDPLSPNTAIFKDRFRVQLADTYATTITSHIAKDGHAFIHFDPVQCRSLTVREAARLQTFPDSYVFLGNRTSQYTQVGNAVPPYLANQIADLVADVLQRAGVADRQPAPHVRDELEFA